MDFAFLWNNSTWLTTSDTEPHSTSEAQVLQLSYAWRHWGEPEVDERTATRFFFNIDLLNRESILINFLYGALRL